MDSNAVAVTVSIRGLPAPCPSKPRMRILAGAVRRAIAIDSPVHVVLFPGGYFRYRGFLSGLSFDDRKQRLDHAPFADAIKASARELDEQCEGALLVVGIDTAHKGAWGDQLCVAWGASGVKGIGRKVFPVKGGEAENYPVNAHDFSEEQRLVALPQGKQAMLCSCYDGFGIHDPRRYGRLIKRIGAAGEDARSWRASADFEKAIHDWESLCQKANMALIAIHHFYAGATSTMWQRHGIASASAKLGGAPALAAAHFQDRLPARGRQVLASKGVRRRHLSAGHHRRAEPAQPIDEWSDGDVRMLWFDL